MLHSICQQIWKTQQWPQDWKRSVFMPIPKKGNAKECSNYHTIALISHTLKVMLRILQARLQQYVNCELPDVQAGFRKGRATRDQIANIHCFLVLFFWNVLVAQSCQTLCNPKDCSLPVSSVCGISQARILQWVAISFSRGSSQPRDQTQVSYIAGRHFTVRAPGKPNIHWITEKPREFQKNIYFSLIDYAKAFGCMDYNKLWKILQEMGIQDHLTCLLVCKSGSNS